MSLRSFNKLKQSMDSDAWDVLAKTIAPKTAPIFVDDYLGIYISCAVAHARIAYKELLNVARTNRGLLIGEPGAWAMACMRQMIKDSRFYVESWLQCVCDNRTYRPATVMNEVQLQKSWRPPALCFMSPLGPLPYKEEVAWNRLNERAGAIAQTFAADSYEKHVLYHVEQLAATEEFDALKIGDLLDARPASTLPVAASRTSSEIIHVVREARKKKTLAMHRAWGTEYRKLTKRRPGKSDVWYSEQIASTKVGNGRSAETIRKNMKKTWAK
jgi:hypothetical protein